MKSKKIICLVLVILMMILTFNINSYAVTLPELMITSYNYAVGDKMRYDDVKDVEVEQTLQLYAVIAHGNEMLVDDNYDSLGWFVDEANFSGVTWTSSNNSIATVDNNGKVTGVAKGKATITAKYSNETANYEVNVIERTSFYVTMRVGTEGGSITSEQGLVAGKTFVEKGKNLKIYICPDEGYEIDKVLVDNEAIDLSSLVYEKNNPNVASEDGVAVYTFTNVSKNYTIEVYYKKKSNSDPTKSPVNPGSTDSPTTKTDITTSKTILPQTGENQIIFVLLISSIVIVTFTYMGYKKYKKIG